MKNSLHFCGFFYVSHFQQPAKKIIIAIHPGGQWMANGNNGSLLTPAKIISICIGVTIGINGWSLILMQEHGNEISEIRQDLERRTDQRYRISDAARDFRLVEFRFERNEANIQQCMDFIRNHQHKIIERQMLKFNEIGENFT